MQSLFLKPKHPRLLASLKLSLTFITLTLLWTMWLLLTTPVTAKQVQQINLLAHTHYQISNIPVPRLLGAEGH